MSVRIRPAAAADWAAVRLLLEQAGLPVADLDADRMPQFLVAVDAAGHTVGAVGIEACGPTALLRSLVVSAGRRDAGCGASLVAALEDRARSAGVTELWLLTTDADRYFLARGYRVADRTAAPAAIRGSRQFSSICPASAILMRKSLA